MTLSKADKTTKKLIFNKTTKLIVKVHKFIAFAEDS